MGAKQVTEKQKSTKTFRPLLLRPEIKSFISKFSRFLFLYSGILVRDTGILETKKLENTTYFQSSKNSKKNTTSDQDSKIDTPIQT